jgi:ubiquitin-conjugating enzyme E2 L3|uniref:E2 ubiquitin-conjugating enzyme n=1 Tax=Panagrolaimus davidi TaxID=227884 RepID=A0A914PDX4_9BILA
MGSYSRRLQMELKDVMSAKDALYKPLAIDEKNILHWEILLMPNKEPYHKGVFKIAIDFPAEYPFKPPKLNFLTKIYHPNVDEKGNVCLGIISPDHWKPATRAEQVLHCLLSLIMEPDLEHPLRADLAEEYQTDKKKFFKNAEDYCKKNSEKRPDGF